MSRRNPVRFLAGLAVEITALVVGVSLLPKLPWGQAGPSEFADQKPSLAENSPTGPSVFVGRRPSIIQSLPPTKTPDPFRTPFSGDPAYVEQRLDYAGQQLLSGVTTYLQRTTDELLRPAPPLPGAPRSINY